MSPSYFNTTYRITTDSTDSTTFRSGFKDLDEIPPGRRDALAVLLDNEDLGVRASAGAFLWRLMPERALPVLHDVHDKARGTGAGFTAMWALSAHRMEDKC